MKRTVDEIAAEKSARIAALKAQYTEEAIRTSETCAPIINADYLTDEIRNRTFAKNCITAEAVELNKRVNAIADEYADELAAALREENEAEPVPAWLADLIEFS